MVDEKGSLKEFFESPEVVEHLSACSECRKVRETSMECKTLIQTLGPSQSCQLRIREKTLSAILHPPSFPGNETPSSTIFPRFFPSFLISGMAFAILLYCFPGLLSPGTHGDPSRPPLNPQIHFAMVSGQLCMVSSGTQTLITGEGPAVPLFGHERLSIKDEESCVIHLPNNRQVVLKGAGEFQFSIGQLKVFSADALVTIPVKPTNLRIRLPTMILGIRGTVLRIKVSPEFEEVRLESGQVSWVSPLSTPGGILNPGQGIRIDRSKISFLDKEGGVENISLSVSSFPVSVNPSKKPVSSGSEKMELPGPSLPLASPPPGADFSQPVGEAPAVATSIVGIEDAF